MLVNPEQRHWLGHPQRVPCPTAKFSAFAERLLTAPRPPAPGQHSAGAHSHAGEPGVAPHAELPMAAAPAASPPLTRGAARVLDTPLPGVGILPAPGAHWRVLSAKICTVDASKQLLVRKN